MGTRTDIPAGRAAVPSTKNWEWSKSSPARAEGPGRKRATARVPRHRPTPERLQFLQLALSLVSPGKVHRSHSL